MAAALVTGEPYYRVKTGIHAAGHHTSTGFRGAAMVQYHPADDLLRTQYENSGLGNSTSDTEKETEKPPVRPAFIHANTPKINGAHLLDEGSLFDEVDKDKRIRLWGEKDVQERDFGYDLERVVWDFLRTTGCELEHVFEEWKHRKNVCRRLREHWDAVY